MKTVHTSTKLTVPEGVTVEIKSRIVTITGPRGILKKSFKHTDMELELITEKVGKNKGSKAISVTMWHAGRKHSACLRTCVSHLSNMIKGVTKGFRYKMRLVYAHFPINVSVADNKKSLEIRNFLGERITRKVDMLEGVEIALGTGQKDELVLEGNDIENVSQSAATIRQSVLVKNKDIRKFLDGIYVSEKGAIVEE
jgi:large subunit ribosomal protein L9e